MTGPELVMHTLRSAQTACPAPGLAQGREPVVATGEDLPRVALVADIPEDFVARGVEGPAEGDRQLDDPQPRADVAAGLRDDVDQPLPYLVGELLQLRP